jgi:hypothetical protein
MSQFTRRHYVALANMIRISLDKHELVDALCSYFRADNSRFDADKFRAVALPELEPKINERR